MTDRPRLRLFLVHHAHALGPKEDPQRPLSPAGRAWADEAALEAARRGVRPSRIWHSGKLRARQTAEAFWRACNPLAEFRAERGLQPQDPPNWIVDRLLAEDGELLVVGHMPHLAGLRRLLVTGRADAPGLEFPGHGVVALDLVEDHWVERWHVAPETQD